MTYQKPEIARLGFALDAVRTTTVLKINYWAGDYQQNQVPPTDTAISPAYEADE